MEDARELVRQAPGLNPRDKAAMLVQINAPGNPGLSILKGVHPDEVKDVVVYLEERRNAGEEKSRNTVSILMPLFAAIHFMVESA